MKTPGKKNSLGLQRVPASDFCTEAFQLYRSPASDFSPWVFNPFSDVHDLPATQGAIQIQ